jgi:hypothetical protein
MMAVDLTRKNYMLAFSIDVVPKKIGGHLK